jgi:hypothetical protein
MLTYFTRPVVGLAIREHNVEVINTLISTVVIVCLQTLFDGSHVHRCFDDFIVVLKESC